MQTTLELEEQSGSPLGSDPCSVRALSLWRPWADWVILGWKPIETRMHQRFRCLGERPTTLAIHAAAKWDKNAIEAARQWLTEDQIRLTETIIRQHPVEGHVIGTVEVRSFGPLSDKHEARALIECRSVQRYGLFLVNPTPLVPPYKVRGMQGLFRVQIPSQNTLRPSGPPTNQPQRSKPMPAKTTAETTKPSGSDAPTCWADLTPDQRNTLIGERLGAKPMTNIWLVWQPMKPDGSILCKKHIGQLGDMPMAEAEKWLADSKKSKAEWTRRNINLDWLLREDVSLFEQRWHINYTTTPGGGWMVIEAMRPHVENLFVMTCEGGQWEVMAIPWKDEDITCRAATMEEAACELALLILPNSVLSRPASADNTQNP